jgi:hypothetical protein
MVAERRNEKKKKKTEIEEASVNRKKRIGKVNLVGIKQKSSKKKQYIWRQVSEEKKEARIKRII